MLSQASPRIEQLGRRPELLPVVAKWIYEEWWEGEDEASLEKLTGLLRPHLVPDRIPLTLVALIGSEPVGTATLLEHDVGTEKWPELCPWMAAVYVVPEQRHRGVGGALVKAIVAQAATIGRNVLYLLTVGREEFYAALGWQVLDRAGDSTVMKIDSDLKASP